MRYSKKVKEKIQQANKIARQTVTKPKRPYVHRQNSENATAGSWLVDERGEQGEVFFDGVLYWLTVLSPVAEGEWDALIKGINKEQWEGYKNKPTRTGTTKKVVTSERRVNTDDKKRVDKLVQRVPRRQKVVSELPKVGSKVRTTRRKVNK